LSPVLAVSFALVIGWFVMQNHFAQAFGHFRMLVGGKQEASRVTLAHQVYAAYRRYDSAQLQQLVNRAETYNPVIAEAAKVFGIDPNLLQGIAATESSFLPRDSKDGGHGLFQITLAPKAVMAQAGRQLAVSKPSLLNPRDNAFIAAATLKYYLAEMHNDLFLGLLAYNIGPANGGLRFIMQQYGATDFVTIQPYLQQLPRDYPIRVLSHALAFRLWQTEGKLLVYEEGDNAMRIQRIGIPGLQAEL
jgi:soluble lytic murein transglycosylase-like protein